VRWRLGGWILLMLLGALAIVPPAMAHAFLVQSDPAPGSQLEAPPRWVRLWFSEPVDPALSRIEVYDKARRRVDRGDLIADPNDPRRLQIALEPIPEGAYTVVWQAFSRVDGHLTRGFFSFAVGRAVIPGASASTVSFPLWALGLQGIHRLAFLIGFGLLIFYEWIFRPAVETLGPTGQPLAWIGARRIHAVFLFALMAEGLQAIAQFLALTPDLPPTAQSALLERVGTEALIRGAMISGAMLMGMAPRGAQRSLRLPRALLVLGALGTFSTTSHGAALGTFSAWLFDFLHRVWAALWIGGLFGLAGTLGTLRVLPPGTRRLYLAIAVPRFSRLALLSVIGLAITGLYNAWIEVGTPDWIWRTSYGRLLIAKSALLTLLLPIAAWNRFRMQPRFAQGNGHAEQAIGPFQKLVLGEVLGVIAIVALAIGLAATPPPRSLPSTGAVAPARILLGRPAEDLRLRLALIPSDTPRRFEIEITDPRGSPLPDLQRVIMELTLLDSDIGVRRVRAQLQPDGHWLAEETLSLPGFWRIRVIVRRQGREDVSSDFPFYQPGGPLATASNDPQALALLQRADEAMNRLQTARMEEELNDGDGRVLFATYAFQAPDRMRLQIEGGASSITIGKVQYVEEDGRWQMLTLADPFRFPDFQNARTVEAARLGREEPLGEARTRVVVARALSGRLTLAFWIDEDNFHLHQVMMAGPGHFMVQRYRDFNAPLAIEPPADAPRAP